MEFSERDYSPFFRQFVANASVSNALDNSNLNQTFLPYSTLNQIKDFPPVIPLQTPTENLVGPEIFNSFEHDKSFLQNSATDELNTVLKTINNLHAPLENLSGSKTLNGFESHQPLWMNFARDTTDHVSSFPRQFLPINAIKNIGGPNSPKNVSRDQLLEIPIIENLQENSLPIQPKSEEISDEILKEKDPLTGLLMPKSTSSNDKEKSSLKIHDILARQLAKASPKWRKQNGVKTNLPRGKIQVGSSNVSGDKEVKKPTAHSLLASFIKVAYQNLPGSLSSPIPSSDSPPTITRGSQSLANPVNHYEDYTNEGFDWNMKYRNMSNGSATSHYDLASCLARSSSACDYDKLKTMSSQLLETEISKWQSNLQQGRNWKGIDLEFGFSFNDQNKMSFLTPSQGTKNQMPNILASTNQLDCTNQVLNQNFTSLSFAQECNIMPVMSAVKPSIFHDGHKNSHVLRENLNEAMPMTYIWGCQTREDLGTKMDTQTSNLESLKVGEKDFENMVNWPEHHLMGTDRFGFDI